jgi:hypothetical protein
MSDEKFVFSFLISTCLLRVMLTITRHVDDHAAL